MYPTNKISHNTLLNLLILLGTSIITGIIAGLSKSIALNWFGKEAPIFFVRASNGSSVLFILVLALIIFLAKTDRIEY